MDQNLIRLLEEEAAASGIDAVTMPSGAGHDCATFAWQGIRTAMLFIRNENGSHNPDEAMAMDDFAEALKLLVRALRRVG
jgi:N-carbamoyl-L-amino-acid hydrolase